MDSFTFNKLRDEFVYKVKKLYGEEIAHRDKKFKHLPNNQQIKTIWSWLKAVVYESKHEDKKDNCINVIKTVRTDQYRNFCKNVMSVLKIDSFSDFQEYIISLIQKQNNVRNIKIKKLLDHSPKHYI